MADIQVVRAHRLGLVKARKIAFRWAEHVEEKFDMTCTYEEGDTGDEVCFARSGVNGTLLVTKESFELKVKLGLIVGAFKGRIEGEIIEQLDLMLAPDRGARAPGTKKK